MFLHLPRGEGLSFHRPPTRGDKGFHPSPQGDKDGSLLRSPSTGKGETNTVPSGGKKTIKISREPLHTYVSGIFIRSSHQRKAGVLKVSFKVSLGGRNEFSTPVPWGRIDFLPLPSRGNERVFYASHPGVFVGFLHWSPQGRNVFLLLPPQVEGERVSGPPTQRRGNAEE